MSVPVCPLCKHKSNEKRFSENGYDVLVCNECGLFFIDPYPTNFTTRREVVSNYSYSDLSINNTKKQQRGEEEYYLEHFQMIDQECINATSILDVGCGTGGLLKLLSHHPNLVREGVELNTDRANVARKVSGCPIHQEPIERFSPGRRFDVISMINVLSHIPFIQELFINLNNLLSENGRFVLAAGEMRHDVRRSDVIGWGIPDHVHFLRLNTIDYICQSYGFHIKKGSVSHILTNFFLRLVSSRQVVVLRRI